MAILCEFKHLIECFILTYSIGQLELCELISMDVININILFMISNILLYTWVKHHSTKLGFKWNCLTVLRDALYHMTLLIFHNSDCQNSNVNNRVRVRVTIWSWVSQDKIWLQWYWWQRYVGDFMMVTYLKSWRQNHFVDNFFSLCW